MIIIFYVLLIHFSRKNWWIAEIRQIIEIFNDDTVTGYDRITVKIIKSIYEVIITSLVYIYNLSIQNSIFPDNFKITIIKPLWWP